MRIYLVRHGIAQPRGEGVGDAERGLSAKGRTRVYQIARGLRRLKVRPEVILTSPLRRAHETAIIMARALGGVEVAELAELRPDSTPPQIMEALALHLSLEQLALVGHQPNLGELAAFLVTGDPRGCELQFKKGGVACLAAGSHLNQDRYSLSWLMQPRELRGL